MRPSVQFNPVALGWPGAYFPLPGGGMAFREVSRDSGAQRQGIVWQDRETRNKIYVTWFGSTTLGSLPPTTMELKLPAAPKRLPGSYWLMVGATSDGGSRIWIFTMTNKGNHAGKAEEQAGMMLLKYNSHTGAMEKAALKDKLHICAPIALHGSMAYRHTINEKGVGELGLIYSGGKRGGHQGAIIAVFNAHTLANVNSFQSASHSFGNRLAVSPDGKSFIATESGDNFPRGLVLHRFSGKKGATRLAYQVRTWHMRTPGSLGEGAKPYPGKPGYYRWSNDNGVYHQLSKAVPLESGETLVFLFGQSHPSLKHRSPRPPDNLACIKVSKKFFERIDEDYKKKCKGPVCLNYYRFTQPNPEDFVFKDEVPSEQGGFYNFMGEWSAQSNYGVKWLTNLTETPHKLKTVRLGGNKNLIMFVENSNWKSAKSMFMTVDDNCNVTRAPQAFNYPVLRFAPLDDVSVDKATGTAFFYDAEIGQDRKQRLIMRYDISIGD
eukprot:gnl/TRDRNA2_/TRDRNA2_167975_c0_seq2.p1 gnl/TRDRNA2_/TRDRNA2_167975_c0~~gnl/TRDRNA2_/TRDRNA2_167975_c0_seq2.p1  ORF type:complete len:560 (+),score=71.65 gnl/TRDRNA2_/TRDRNA2_167975_c0_seq2:204-1682(+)